MKLRIGSYTFDSGTCEVSIERRGVDDEAGEPFAYEETWNVRARILNPTANSSTMRTLLQRMEAGVLPGRDVKLLTDQNADTHHRLLNNGTIGGVRLTQPPSYPEGRGFEYGTYRTVQFTLAATVPTSGRTTNIISFQEVIQSEGGGGPRQGHLEPLTGAPIKQTLKQRTIWRAAQRGSATALGGYPAAPDPIWPNDLIEPGGDPVQKGPVVMRGGDVYLASISWEYRFEASQKRFGSPHVWVR